MEASCLEQSIIETLDMISYSVVAIAPTITTAQIPITDEILIALSVPSIPSKFYASFYAILERLLIWLSG